MASLLDTADMASRQRFFESRDLLGNVCRFSNSPTLLRLRLVNHMLRHVVDSRVQKLKIKEGVWRASELLKRFPMLDELHLVFQPGCSLLGVECFSKLEVLSVSMAPWYTSDPDAAKELMGQLELILAAAAPQLQLVNLATQHNPAGSSAPCIQTMARISAGMQEGSVPVTQLEQSPASMTETQAVYLAVSAQEDVAPTPPRQSAVQSSIEVQQTVAPGTEVQLASARRSRLVAVHSMGFEEPAASPRQTCSITSGSSSSLDSMLSETLSMRLTESHTDVLPLPAMESVTGGLLRTVDLAPETSSALVVDTGCEAIDGLTHMAMHRLNPNAQVCTAASMSAVLQPDRSVSLPVLAVSHPWDICDRAMASVVNCQSNSAAAPATQPVDSGMPQHFSQVSTEAAGSMEEILFPPYNKPDNLLIECLGALEEAQAIEPAVILQCQPRFCCLACTQPPLHSQLRMNLVTTAQSLNAQLHSQQPSNMSSTSHGAQPQVHSQEHSMLLTPTTTAQPSSNSQPHSNLSSQSTCMHTLPIISQQLPATSTIGTTQPFLHMQATLANLHQQAHMASACQSQQLHIASHMNPSASAQLPAGQCQQTRITSVLEQTASTQFSACQSQQVHPAASSSQAASGSHHITVVQLPACFKNLQRLRLSSCGLTAVPAGICQLVSLKTLDLSDNQLLQVPEEIGNLTELGQLLLAHNCLTWLPQSLTRLCQLRMLSLSHNQLHALPCAIDSSFPQLAQLHLQRAFASAPGPEASTTWALLRLMRELPQVKIYGDPELHWLLHSKLRNPAQVS